MLLVNAGSRRTSMYALQAGKRIRSCTHPYLLLTAFAAAQNATPEARVGLFAKPNTAAPPPVCEIFKEFCDCAACLVLDRQGACDLCPNL